MEESAASSDSSGARRAFFAFCSTACVTESARSRLGRFRNEFLAVQHVLFLGAFLAFFVLAVMGTLRPLRCCCCCDRVLDARSVDIVACGVGVALCNRGEEGLEDAGGGSSESWPQEISFVVLSLEERSSMASTADKLRSFISR